MRLLVIALTFAAIPPFSAAQLHADPRTDCVARYQAVFADAKAAYPALTAGQQTRLDPVIYQLRTSLDFLRSTEGQTGYPALCTVDVLAALTRLQASVRATQPPTMPQLESEAQRAALLKSLADYDPR
jgi:hypothetical protein